LAKIYLSRNFLARRIKKDSIKKYFLFVRVLFIFIFVGTANSSTRLSYMAMDWSFVLHGICVRVELDVLTAAQKGYLFEFTAFIILWISQVNWDG
jgi:hypothetical protein